MWANVLSEILMCAHKCVNYTLLVNMPVVWVEYFFLMTVMCLQTVIMCCCAVYSFTNVNNTNCLLKTGLKLAWNLKVRVCKFLNVHVGSNVYPGMFLNITKNIFCICFRTLCILWMYYFVWNHVKQSMKSSWSWLKVYLLAFFYRVLLINVHYFS